jgi:hypothetical protein
MNFLPITLSPENRCIHLLLEGGSFVSGMVRDSSREFSELSSFVRNKQVLIATVLIMAVSWACLSIAIPETVLVPSSLMGGVHPDSIDLFL